MRTKNVCLRRRRPGVVRAVFAAFLLLAAAQAVLADSPRFLTSDAPPWSAASHHALNINAADTTNADQLWAGGGLGLDLDGSGLTVGVWDGGWVRDTHQELAGRVTVGDAGASLSNHATHVAGTIGSKGAFQPNSHGMANNVLLRSYDWNNDIAEMDADADLLVASNHSYAYVRGWVQLNDPAFGWTDVWYADRSVYSTEDPGFGKYDNTSRNLDRVLYDHPHLLSVWAAGNDRNDQFTNRHGDNTYVTWLSAGPSGPGWYQVSTADYPAPPRDGNAGAGYDCLPQEQVAKNTLVVGAIGDITADPYTKSDVSMTSFSSWGPTDDGRVKPDVVANGGSLYSTLATSDSAYGTYSGTSMASPNATGTAVLLIQHYQNLFGSSPRSATTKGLIIHTAFDAGNTGPDYTYGWGVLDGAAAAVFLSSTQEPDPTDWLVEGTYSGLEQTWMVYSDGTAALKATLCWTDPPPELGDLPGNGLDDPTRVLVNDLDLWITGPDGTVYRPWTLDPLHPGAAAVPGVNDVDNVEQVLLAAPGPGYYVLHIGHAGADFTQDYSLLVSGGVPAPVPEPWGIVLFAMGLAGVRRRRR